MTTPVAKLRRQILHRIGKKPLKNSKRLVPVHEYPDDFPKTAKMKMLEYKYHIKLEHILFSGSLMEVSQKLNGEVTRSAVSKWRWKFQQYMYKKEIKEW